MAHAWAAPMRRSTGGRSFDLAQGCRARKDQPESMPTYNLEYPPLALAGVDWRPPDVPARRCQAASEPAGTFS